MVTRFILYIGNIPKVNRLKENEIKSLIVKLITEIGVIVPNEFNTIVTKNMVEIEAVDEIIKRLFHLLTSVYIGENFVLSDIKVFPAFVVIELNSG